MQREKLIGEREKRGWTQEYAAGLTGTTQQNISLIENGRRKPSLVLAKRFERIYGRSMEELFPDIFFKTNTTLSNVRTSGNKERTA